MDTRFESIHLWLAECLSERHGFHASCFASKIPGHPTRLLDLRDLEWTGYIRLVETGSWPELPPDYTTLGHR